MITEENLVSTGSLDKLAKLLAAEDIAVEHRPVPTAYFDVKHRILALPMWKDMPQYLYHMLVLHEVGHSLFTDADGWEDIVTEHKKQFHGYLNVIEDARIERKMKTKFPGSRKDFVDGYDDLHKRDFFKLEDRDINSLSLIDRINLYFKLGTRIKLRFTEEEMVFVRRAEETMTFEDVIALALDLFGRAKDKQEQQQIQDQADGFGGSEGEETESDEDGDGEYKDIEDGDSSETEASASAADSVERATTDESMTDRMHELIVERHSEIKTNYIHVPADIDSGEYICGYKRVLEMYHEDCKKLNDKAVAFRNKLFVEFRRDNNSAINYMVKEFEMKKAASAYSRSKQSKTGAIDTNKLHGYKYNDDIFRRLTIVPDGKNHGIMIFVDWSGSMSSNFHGSIQQLLNIVTFCRRVGIAHRVYGFSSLCLRGDDIDARNAKRNVFLEKNPGTSYMYPCEFLTMLELFHEKMSPKEFNEMTHCLLLAGQRYDQRYDYMKQEDFVYVDDIPWDFCSFLGLASTPLNDSLLIARDMIRKFRKEKNIEVMNFVCITDGESNGTSSYVRKSFVYGDKDEYHTLASPIPVSPVSTHIKQLYKYILIDEKTKLQFRIEKPHYLSTASSVVTSLLSRLIRDDLGVHMVGFYILSGRNDVRNVCRSYMGHLSDKTEEICKKFSKDASAVVPNMLNFDEFYLIRGGRHLKTETSEMEAGATKGQLLREFRKAQNKRGASRTILARFIEKIAIAS